jgi:hypothetical protein
MKFPFFSVLLKDGTGVIFIRHGSDLWLPLFTDHDSVHTYLERSGIKECQVIELPSSTRLADFLKNPPSRAGGSKVDTVVVDPLDPSPRAVTLFAVEKLLAALKV